MPVRARPAVHLRVFKMARRQKEKLRYYNEPQERRRTGLNHVFFSTRLAKIIQNDVGLKETVTNITCLLIDFIFKTSCTTTIISAGQNCKGKFERLFFGREPIKAVVDLASER